MDCIELGRDVEQHWHTAGLDGRSDGGGETPAATPITSSPGRSRLSPNNAEVTAVSASKLALEPLLHSITSRMPRKSASWAAACWVNRPSVHRPSRLASTQ